MIVGAFPDHFLTQHGEGQVRALGHRRYVGGDWDEIGTGCFQFLIDQGLKPDHVLLDIACGALRLGVHAIPYLDSGNYLGIEKEAALLDAGKTKELDDITLAAKQPDLIVSANFEFGRFSKRPDYVVAFSLFTHLTPALIEKCLHNLRPILAPQSQFFASFLPPMRFARNPTVPNDFAAFRYSMQDMVTFGARHGMVAQSVNWRFADRQRLVRFTLS